MPMMNTSGLKKKDLLLKVLKIHLTIIALSDTGKGLEVTRV